MAINLTMGMDADEVDQLNRSAGAARDNEAEVEAEAENQREDDHPADEGDEDGQYEEELSDYGDEGLEQVEL